MGFELSERDISRLDGVHPDLVKVVKRAAQLSDQIFIVTEGLRSISRQKELVRKGFSKTMRSRHIRASNGFGHAVDLAPIVNGTIPWNNWKKFEQVAHYMKQAAREVGVSIEWGGDWRSFKDGPHFQLPWKSYPGKSVHAASFADLSSSRTVQGSSTALVGGSIYTGNELSDIMDKFTEANGYLTTGDIISITIGTIIIVGALFALYARWDDAGRPLPWKKNKVQVETFDDVEDSDDVYQGE